jgi:hypothetical protein
MPQPSIIDAEGKEGSRLFFRNVTAPPARSNPLSPLWQYRPGGACATILIGRQWVPIQEAMGGVTGGTAAFVL